MGESREGTGPDRTGPDRHQSVALPVGTAGYSAPKRDAATVHPVTSMAVADERHVAAFSYDAISSSAAEPASKCLGAVPQHSVTWHPLTQHNVYGCAGPL